MIEHAYRQGKLIHGDAIEACSGMPDRSVRLIYCDGPYGLGKGEWDQAIGPALVDWYAPHFNAWDRVLMPSCSLVVWGTTRSWAYLHVELERRGWEQAGQVVWSKGAGWSMRSDPEVMRSWPQTHEIVGIYRRGRWVLEWLLAEWEAAGLRRQQANEACRVADMATRKYFRESQWLLPSWEHFQSLARHAFIKGRSLPSERNGRPWLMHHLAPGSLRETYDLLKAPFNIGTAMPSVWNESPPTLGAARHGHECEKPASITRKLIETLTLPGEMVFEPFGGSSPVGRVCEAMPQGQERRWLSCEIDSKHIAATRAMLTATQGRLL